MDNAHKIHCQLSFYNAFSTKQAKTQNAYLQMLGADNKFSNYLSNLDFSLSGIKLCTRTPLDQRKEALAPGVGQWHLLAPAM